MSDLSAKSQEDGKALEVEDDRWKCSKCTFSNVLQLTQCEMCEAPSTISHKKIKVEEKKTEEKKPVDKGACPDCTFINPKAARRCEMCGEVLIKDQAPPTVSKPAKVLTKCTACRFDNDPDNERCVGCDKYLKEPPAAVWPGGRGGRGGRGRVSRGGRGGMFGRGMVSEMSTCPICSSEISGPLFPAHYKQCQESIKIVEDSSYKATLAVETCNYCDAKFSRTEVLEHVRECPKKVEYFENEAVFGRMTPLQKNAIVFMHDNGEKQHYAAKPLLLKRIMRMGYKASDLEALHHYLENYAPIIVHIHVSRYMDFFVKDTHYRNQFETSTSSGSLSHSARTSWENRMFNHRYSKATGFERVKYGTVNFTNDPKGVRACAGYGASYFLLKSTVRSRCTFTDMDSSSPSSTIATFKFSYHGLNKLSDAQIKAAFEAAKANEMSSSVISAYKEIQIHGPIEFARDIERIYVNKTELAEPKRLEQIIEFSKKNKVEYEIFEPQAPAAMMFGGGFAFGGGVKPSGPAPVKIAPRFVGSAVVAPPEPKSQRKPAAPRLPAVLFGYEGGQEQYQQGDYEYGDDYYEQ